MLSNFNKKSKTKINDVIIKTLPTVQYREVLLNNVIEKDLQAVLKPLDFMQRIFICAKYSIQDNFITTNSRNYNVFGIIFAITFRSLLLYNLSSFMFEDKVMYVLGYCNIFDSIFFSIGFILNYYSNIIQCDNHVLLILKIQHVHRILKVNSKHLRHLIVTNWICVIVLNIVYILGTLYFCINFSLTHVLDLLSNYSSIAFDINIVYAAFVMSLLRKTLCVWIEDIQVSRNVGLDSESYWTIMFDVYSNILAAYKIFEKSFRLLVLHYTLHTVCHGLITVMILLEMRQLLANAERSFGILAVISQMWIVKSTVLQILMCVESEKLYATIKEVNYLCTMLRRSGCSGTQRRVCKNIQRLQHSSFNKMTAFGLFVVDATLPLRIFGVITNYTLALLQFAV